MPSRRLAALLALAAAATACSGDISSTTSGPLQPTIPTPVVTQPVTTAGIRFSPAPTTSTRPPITGTNSMPTTAPPPTTLAAPEARTMQVEIEVEGRPRRYTLHVPAGLDGTPVALVVDLHGLTSTAQRHDALSNMRAKASEEGFVLAQPEAGLMASAWNTLEGSTDVAFARAVVADVARRVPIDPERVFASGFSAGGGMAHRLACDAADLFTAVATVSGAYFGWARCEPSRPVSVVSFHGDADIVVPIEGLGLLPDIASWAATWAEHDGCETTAQAVVDIDVALESWTGCDAGARVFLFTIAGGGHGWPGTSDPGRVDDTTAVISATDLIWDFFLASPRSDA